MSTRTASVQNKLPWNWPCGNVSSWPRMTDGAWWAPNEPDIVVVVTIVPRVRVGTH